VATVDRIFINGDVRTGDPAHPLAQAMAISNGRIAAVGKSDDVLNLAGPDTKIIHLENRLVLPGFIDSHIHFGPWSLGLSRLELSGAGSFDEFLKLVAMAASEKPEGAWLLGQGWNETEWPENRQPTVLDLDRIAPRNPVLLWRCDLHMAVANSLALNIAGITENTPDPPEGMIVRDSNGRPNGLVREGAVDLVADKLPPVGDDALEAAFKHGQKIMHQVGVTGLCDVPLMNDPESAARHERTWIRLAEQGDLGLRVWSGIAGESLDKAIASGLRTGTGGDFLRTGPVKYFADGGMGARTAWMLEPYLDGGTGMPLIDMAVLEDGVRRADRAGFAVMIHAIGDRAVREVVGILDRVIQSRSGTEPSVPHRIEHVQMIRPEDLDILKRLNVVASMQPPNMIIDMNLIDECLGDKGKWVYAFGDVMRAGVDVVFSSDAPVCDHRPVTGIFGAVTRQRPNLTPEGGWRPSQRISLDQAVQAYTTTPARIHGAVNELGILTAGKKADFIVLDQNIYHIPALQIATTQVDMTVVSGDIVFQRG
jgi:predicted amidohydrolase YtcJ